MSWLTSCCAERCSTTVMVLQFPTIGIAGGYIFGGIIGPAYGWQAPFFIQVCTHHPDSCPSGTGRMLCWFIPPNMLSPFPFCC